MAPPAFLSRIDASFRRFQRKGDARALGLVFDARRRVMPWLLGLLAIELPETYRSAAEQHLFSNADAATIARRLGISDGTFHVRVHRGLGLLRGLLPAGTALGAGLVLGDVRGLASVRATVMGTGAAAGVGAATATASGGIFAFRDFAKDPGAYASWRARTAGLTRREVLLQGARDLALLRGCGE